MPSPLEKFYEIYGKSETPPSKTKLELLDIRGYNNFIKSKAPQYNIQSRGEVLPMLKSEGRLFYESQSLYINRLINEEDAYQKYIQNLEDYNRQFRLEALNAQLASITSPEYKNNSNPNLFHELAISNLLEAKDAEGNYKLPQLRWDTFVGDPSKEKAEYEKRYNEINALNRDFRLEEDRDYLDNKAADDVFQSLVARGLFKEEDKEEFLKLWNDTPYEDKKEFIIGALGRKYLNLSAKDWLEFENASSQDRFDMLAASIVNNPYYKGTATKLSESIDWGDNAFANWWKEGREYAVNRFLTGDNFYDVGYKLGAGVTALTFGTGEFFGSLAAGIGEWGQSILEGKGTLSYEDKDLVQAANRYINKKSEDVYLAFKSLPLEELTKIYNSFKKESENASHDYLVNKGNRLTKLNEVNDFDDVLKEASRVQAISNLYGQEAANRELRVFWGDTIANNQTALDKVGRAAGQFGVSAVADLAGFAAVVYNIIPATLNVEGYSDYLVLNNALLKYANDLQETGCFSLTGQEEYKKLGANQFQIYQTEEDKNSILSLSDIPVLIGQYGFTAASTLASWGTSGAIRWGTLKAIKQAAKDTFRGKLARGMMSSTTRELLKAGLKEGKALSTQALATLARLESNGLYKANLWAGGLVGTAEGALEAKSTYETFKKEAMEKWEPLFKSKEAEIDNMSKELLRMYMASKGYEAPKLVKDAEGNIRTEYSEEQYEKAKIELRSELEEAKKAAIDRIEDDAADAAFANFISNSLINGALNVSLKSSLMSRDVKEAVKIRKGVNKKLHELVDVVKNEKGEWVAKAKLTLKNISKKDIFDKSKEVVVKTAKTASGEFIEEFSQGISDQAAREALEYDINQYMATVFDKDAREAFQTDWEGILNEGLSSIATSAQNMENIKEGIFGALSSIMGGFNALGVVSTVLGFTEGRPKDTGFFKWALGNLSNLYTGGLAEAYRESRGDIQTAEIMAQNINGWLNNKKSQELLTHIGGAVGFSKEKEYHIIGGNVLSALDALFGLAVENAFMLLALENTEYGKAIYLKLQEAVELMELTREDANFDEHGNYIGLEDWVKDAISTYKNQLGEDSKNTAFSDKQIMKRIGLNANKLLYLQGKIKDIQRTIGTIFRDDEIDTLTLLAIVHAILKQDSSKERAESLRTKLRKAIDKDDSETSGLDERALNFLIQYGSLEKAKETLKKLEEQRNELNELQTKKGIDKEVKASKKRLLKLLEKDITKLRGRIKFEEQRRKSLAESKLVEEGDLEYSVLNEVPTMFTVGDMNRMPLNKIAAILANKAKYSTELQAVIDKFITNVRKNLSDEDGAVDFTITDLDIIKDFEDLSTLELRSTTYDRYLASYIENPEFLTASAKKYRDKERRRALKHMYRDDLVVRDNESPLEYLERLNEKVEELKSKNKLEDANILQGLINENDKVANLNQEMLRTAVASILYKTTHPNIPDDELERISALAKVVVANTGKSLAEIKSTLDRSDTTSIIDALRRVELDGQYSINKALGARGLQTVKLTGDDYQDEAALSEDIEKLKKFVDYIAIVLSEGEADNKKNAQLSVNIMAPGATPKGAPLNAEVPNAALKGGTGLIQNLEAQSIKLITPGDLEASNPLRQFLINKGVNQNLLDFDNSKSGRGTVLAVLKGYTNDPSTVFVLVALLDEESKILGVTISIGGNDYKILGAIPRGASQSIDNLGISTSESLKGSDAQGMLLKDEKNSTIKVEFDYIQSEKAVSENSLSDVKPLLRDTLGGDKAKIGLYANEVVHQGKRTPPNKAKGFATVLKDANGYEVEFKHYDRNTLDETLDVRKVANFPVELEDGTTKRLSVVLKELLSISDPNEQDKAKRKVIEALKKNSYFNCFFKTWKECESISNKDTHIVYDILIGDFICLGYSSLGDAALASLNPTIDNLELTIEGLPPERGVPPKLKFDLPFGSADKEMCALDLLIKLFGEAPEGSEGTDRINADLFKWQLLQLGNLDVMGEKANLPQIAKIREVERLKGLIEAGIVVGNLPTAVRLEMTFINPFALKLGTGSTKNTSKSISDIDPAPKGEVEGGVVDPSDGTTLSGNPLTTKDKVNLEVENGVEQAQKIVKRLEQKSSTIELESLNAGAYSEKNGNRIFGRVTSSKEAVIGLEVEPFEGDDEDATISHALGNTMDATTRAAIDILNNIIDGKDSFKSIGIRELAKELYDKIVNAPNSKFKDAGKIPNWQRYNIENFLTSIINMHIILTTKGWRISSKEIRAFGAIKVFDGLALVGSIDRAGTLDLLAYDSEGKFHIIDIKTIKLNSNYSIEEALDIRTSAWQALVFPYQELLSQEEPTMEFGDNYIFPIFLNYTAQSVSFGKKVFETIVEKDDMTLTNSVLPGRIEFITEKATDTEEINSDDVLELEDFLYKLPNMEFKGYERDRLSKEDKAKVTPLPIESSQTTAGNQVTPEDNPIKPPPPTPAPTASAQDKQTLGIDETLGDLQDEFEFNSKKTEELAEFTEFINNHIRPVTKVKIGVLSRLSKFVLNTLKGRTNNTVFVQELANIFFAGDIEKLQYVVGDTKINKLNLPIIISKLKEYYNSYMNNKDLAFFNVAKRHAISSALLSFLKGDTTISDIEKVLSTYNLKFGNVKELLEWQTSTDKDKTAKSLIAKIEASELHTTERYNEQLLAMTSEFNSMLAKLEFLNSNRALKLIEERIESVYNALENDNYSEAVYNKGGSIDSILSTKKGDYGAIKLLREISTTTKNPHFKKLATRLLREIKNNNLVIPIVVENEGFNFVEGSTNCKVITIYKNSLDSYEHFERVLLHEMIHAVVRLSPKIKNELEGFRQYYIDSIKHRTGKTEKEITLEYYGLSNIDEFITEFFTNYAFLDSLREVEDLLNNSIFDNIVNKIKERLFKSDNKYDELSRLMETIFDSTNKEDTEHKKLELENVKFSNYKFKDLDLELQLAIRSRGFTAQLFNSITLLEQECLIKCCK